MGEIKVPLADDMPATADVVVIGGGIVGVSTAFFCSRAGLKTVVLERRDALGTLTTARSTECFRAQFESPADIDLMLGSIGIFKHFADVVGIPDADIHLRPQGYLYATRDPAQAQAYRRIVDAQHAAGLTDVQLWSGDEARERFPWVSPDIIAARYRAGDGWISVHEMLYGFAKGSQARHCLKTEVTGILKDTQGISSVQTNRGMVSTRAVVVAAGPFSARVARWAGVELPLTLLRRHRLAVLHCELVPRDAPFSMDDDLGSYWRPEGAGALLGKAFEDVPEEPQEIVPVDWTFPAMLLDPESPWSAGRLATFWNQAGGALHKPNLDLTAGQYTYSPDHVPLIGPLADTPGLFVNGGYSGHGIMGGPEGGKRLSRVILGELSDADNPFSPQRFSRPGAVHQALEKVY